MRHRVKNATTNQTSNVARRAWLHMCVHWLSSRISLHDFRDVHSVRPVSSLKIGFLARLNPNAIRVSKLLFCRGKEPLCIRVISFSSCIGAPAKTVGNATMVGILRLAVQSKDLYPKNPSDFRRFADPPSRNRTVVEV